MNLFQPFRRHPASAAAILNSRCKKLGEVPPSPIKGINLVLCCFQCTDKFTLAVLKSSVDICHLLEIIGLVPSLALCRHWPPCRLRLCAISSLCAVIGLCAFSGLSAVLAFCAISVQCLLSERTTIIYVVTIFQVIKHTRGLHAFMASLPFAVRCQVLRVGLKSGPP